MYKPITIFALLLVTLTGCDFMNPSVNTFANEICEYTSAQDGLFMGHEYVRYDQSEGIHMGQYDGMKNIPSSVVNFVAGEHKELFPIQLFARVTPTDNNYSEGMILQVKSCDEDFLNSIQDKSLQLTLREYKIDGLFLDQKVIPLSDIIDDENFESGFYMINLWNTIDFDPRNLDYKIELTLI